MKFCERCGMEISTRDGENKCQSCEDAEGKRLSAKRKLAKSVREQLLRDMGLVKVRGELGGVYWE